MKIINKLKEKHQKIKLYRRLPPQEKQFLYNITKEAIEKDTTLIKNIKDKTILFQLICKNEKIEKYLNPKQQQYLEEQLQKEYKRIYKITKTTGYLLKEEELEQTYPNKKIRDIIKEANEVGYNEFCNKKTLSKKRK